MTEMLLTIPRLP